MRDANKVHFFPKITVNVSFTMVIKSSPSGESANGRRSTSKSTCVIPAWTLIAFGGRPASRMSRFSASVHVNSVLGHGSLWVTVRGAEHVDRCSLKYTRVWSYQLTSDLRYVYYFWICLQWSCLKTVSVPTSATSALVVREEKCVRGVPLVRFWSTKRPGR